MKTRSPWRLAGALLVALVLGGLGLFWWLSPVVRTAPPGERLAFGLPDGSRIELNSGSSVRYARRFGQARRVMLEGEAFFDVVKETRPFVVQTFNARVTVLGTRFNVRAWSRSVDPGTTVTLESGRVALAPADGPGQAVALEPGQTRRISSEVREPSPPDTVATGAATAWRNGDLVFKDQWLGVILEDVERHFAVDLVLAAPALREKPMTVAWRNPASADAVIRDVCAALGLSYRATSNGYEIYAPPPL